MLVLSVALQLGIRLPVTTQRNGLMSPEARPLVRASPRQICMAHPQGKKKKKVLKPTKPPKSSAVAKEKHLFFDEVTIGARGGAGGNGAAVELPKVGKGAWIRRTADGDYDLPPGGGRGGSVVLEVDTSLCDLLHLHDRPPLVAARGADSTGLKEYSKTRRMQQEAEKLANVDDGRDDGPPGSNRRLRPRTTVATNIHDGRDLVVPVPPGTFVRTKSGKVLGDMVAPRQRLVVAQGGSGGPCVLKERPAGDGRKRRPQDGEADLELSDDEVERMVKGLPAQETTLQLLLRTVADVGFVGFPNAGKSTLLTALTRAAPEVAPFPFTTLMPNLGALADAEEGGGGGGGAARVPVLADLPGLIEGAHRGRGLGRQFLRHLRRVRVVLYVLDTTADTTAKTTADADADADADAAVDGEKAADGSERFTLPGAVEQYEALRRELYLYNPEYLARPHLVALNKLDLPLQHGGTEAFDAARIRLSRAIAASAAAATDQTAPPVAIVPLSGLRGKGIRILKQGINRALEAADPDGEAQPGKREGARPTAG